MDYHAHYNRLIERARNRNIYEITEAHHVIPRCMGGDDSIENIVRLTPEEHYVAHQLLVKMFPEHPNLSYAAWMMTVGRKNNKIYGWIRKRYIHECRKRVGSNNPTWGKGRFYHHITGELRLFPPNEVPVGWIKKIPVRSPRPKKPCKKCGSLKCERPKICTNGQRIKRFVETFGFDKTTFGSPRFYLEYDRVVALIKKEYEDEKLSVEDIKIKYKFNHNETVRRMLDSLNINRRSLSDSVSLAVSKSG